MHCPVCKVDMFVLEFEHVEIDYCYRCGGIWLDSGELALIGERAGVLRGGLLAALEQPGRAAPSGQARLLCPVCRSTMVEVVTQTTPPILIDRCPAEHGLWFDSGELADVVAAAGADKENILARFFAELGGPQAHEQS